MFRAAIWKNVFVKDEKKDISELCKIGNALLGATHDLRKNEIAFLRTQKALIRAMCKVMLIKKKRSQELMNLLGLEMLWVDWPGQVECNGMGIF